MSALACLDQARPKTQPGEVAAAVNAALEADALQNRSAEHSVLAKRRAGELLRLLQKTPKKSAATAAGDSEYRKVLNETGLKERTAQYWQQLSDIPEDVVQEYFSTVRHHGSEVTAKGLVGFFTRRELVTTLAEKFGAPPFSVLDAKQGYFMNRQRAWEGLGISGEAGRDDEHAPALGSSLNRFGQRTDKSVFNCALTETMYQWFAPPGGRILDPFAGGSPRGIVAAKLGYGYTGIELRPGLVEENRRQAQKIGVNPTWVCGDSAKLSGHVGETEEFDLIFTCPPYFDLERYTEAHSEDLSNCKTYDAFMLLYEFIFNQAVARLKEDRFAVVVVGEIRDARGFYRNFVGDTVSLFMRLGLHFYNEIIFATPLGSLPFRGGGQFAKYRKVLKSHQNVLVFWKGDDPTRIPEALGILTAAEPEAIEKAA